jgi:hypothetical protein
VFLPRGRKGAEVPRFNQKIGERDAACAGMFAPAVHLRPGESRSTRMARRHDRSIYMRSSTRAIVRQPMATVRTAFGDPALSARKGPHFIA